MRWSFKRLHAMATPAATSNGGPSRQTIPGFSRARSASLSARAGRRGAAGERACPDERDEGGDVSRLAEQARLVGAGREDQPGRAALARRAGQRLEASAQVREEMAA